MFYYKKSSGFTKVLKVKICVCKSVLNSRRENTGPVTKPVIKSSQIRNNTPLQL